MKNLNKVMLLGHLAADVDLRQTKSGSSVATFPLAINRFIRGDDGKEEAVDFHRVVVWGRLAEICNEYLEKGIAVYVEGRMINRSFDDNDGVKHFRTEVVADNVIFLTWKKSGNKESGGSIKLESVVKQ